MRKILLLFTPLLLVLSVSCTNLSEVNAKLDDHSKRIEALEAMVKKANENIQSLRKLVEAESKKLSIVSFKQLEDGSGFELIMSDQSSIKLTNGKDGNQPAIAVKEENGEYYWTINGEYLLNSSGEKIIAKGKDGKLGITPIVRVNTDGNWEVSYNKGTSWELVYDENGKPVKAESSEQDKGFSITEDSEYVYITYMGQTFKLPKSDTKIEIKSLTITPSKCELEVGNTQRLTVEITPSNANATDLLWESDNEKVATVNDGLVTAVAVGTATITAKAKNGTAVSTASIKVIEKSNSTTKLAIEYLAEYNINKEGFGFVNNHVGKNSGYFTWFNATTLYSKDKGFTIAGKGYHLPSLEEWASIIPIEMMFLEEERPDKLNVFEAVSIGGKDYSFTSDYRFPGDYVFYGIRFKGHNSDHYSAWKYEFTDNPDEAGGKVLKITVRPLSKGDNTTLDQIANASYWSDNNGSDIQRILPAAGYLNKSNGEPFYYNEYGQYWSSTEFQNTLAKFVLFSNYLCYSDYQHEKIVYNTVRLFINKL